MLPTILHRALLSTGKYIARNLLIERESQDSLFHYLFIRYPIVGRAQSPALNRDQYDEGILRDKQHHRYPHHHQQPRAMSILVPIEETPGKSKNGSQVRKRATPRASYAPESMRKKPAQFTSRDENRSAQPNSEKPHSVEGVHIYYPLEVLL